MTMSRRTALAFLPVWTAIGCRAPLAPIPDAGGGHGGSTGADARLDGARDLGAPELIPPPRPLCPNGVLDPDEQCDDGNRTTGDGCGWNCQIECWSSCDSCGTAGPCHPLVCGDGIIDEWEICDDGNVTGDDGCSARCYLEEGWRCPRPGAPCIPNCGDGLVVGRETCDDINTVSGDGCSDTCLIEPIAAVARCGDGVLSGAEECDDGANNSDVAAYGRCTTGCRLAGWCGDGIVNGTEECDLGWRLNTSYYGNWQGCGPRCKFPHFCGDAILDAQESEQCDRGAANGMESSGCVASCKLLPD